MQVETRISAIEDNVNKLPTKVKKKKQPKNKTGYKITKRHSEEKKLQCAILRNSYCFLSYTVNDKASKKVKFYLYITFQDKDHKMLHKKIPYIKKKNFIKCKYKKISFELFFERDNLVQRSEAQGKRGHCVYSFSLVWCLLFAVCH